MLYLIDNQQVTDPRLNLAMEEYALRQLPGENDYLHLYVNEPTVVVGRHQNVWEEVNIPYLRTHNMLLIRRISGGGTVVHDPGNINFSFITRYTRERFNNYREFTRPILKALQKLGVPARLNERNDIVIASFKISGNAQFTSRNRLLSHGTLLFHSDLARLRQALQADSHGIESRARRSVPSAVTNIVHYLSRSLTLAEFRDLLLDAYREAFGTLRTYHFSGKDWENILNLSRQKYGSWDWNMGESPPFILRRTLRWRGSPVQMVVRVEKGRIHNIEFSGEEEAVQELRAASHRLPGRRLEYGEVLNGLAEIPEEIRTTLLQRLPV